MICKYCHDKDDGWVREPDGYGCVQWTHCVCMPTDPINRKIISSGGNDEEESSTFYTTAL